MYKFKKQSNSQHCTSLNKKKSTIYQSLNYLKVQDAEQSIPCTCHGKTKVKDSVIRDAPEQHSLPPLHLPTRINGTYDPSTEIRNNGRRTMKKLYKEVDSLQRTVVVEHPTLAASHPVK
jgi:hypothetical protein